MNFYLHILQSILLKYSKYFFLLLTKNNIKRHNFVVAAYKNCNFFLMEYNYRF